METASKLKNTNPGPNSTPVAAGRKTAAKINKTAAVRIDADKTQMKEAAASPATSEVTNKERYQLIAEAAYFRAERRNFVPGHELEDWLEAEAEIEARMLTAGKNCPPENA